MKQPDQLLGLEPIDFVRFLQDHAIHRFCFVLDRSTGRLKSSHGMLQSIADRLSDDTRDFIDHEGMFFQVSRKYDTLQGAFVHRTCRGQAAGGVRYWTYDTVEDYLRDGMRLGIGMTRKNALAGLWWGGGKGVMARNSYIHWDDPEIRRSLYREYGELMTAIRGCYVTAEDVGTHVADMANVFVTTRFTTCVPELLGGSGNPSVPTARGVVAGMEAALEFLDLGGIEGKTIAVQGMGNVGGPLICQLFEKNAGKVIACDISSNRVEAAVSKLEGRNLEASVSAPGDWSILSTACDILAPCATGAILNPDTIPGIAARIVCGAANNQLEDPDRDDTLLHDKGVLYVPDFLTNRMGIVNCADEQAGALDPDPMMERHLSRDWEYSIHRMALEVFEKSRDSGEPPSKVATERADDLSRVENPIFGHRGWKIVEQVFGEWEE